MCGISGFCNLHTDFLEREPYYRNILSDMSDALYHRGPDSHGIYLTSHTGFSHTRLAIIDPHGGLQPMTRHYCDADFTIVYNGELYNTKELREELVSHGMTFRTHSDTEVILNGFLFEGPSFVRKMNGIFAFAIYDEAHQLLYLFRDAFGVKPLFYRLFHDTLIFSSEPKGIFCYPGCIPSVNKTGLSEIFGLGPARNPGNAVYEHMAECLPGHYLTFSASGLKDYCYFRLESHPHTDSYEETVVHTKELLLQSIRRRISYLNIRYFMQTLLNRMDRTSMFSGLEARVPFADKNLVSYVFNVPWEMKAKDGLVKNLLRQCAKDYLPDTITFRKKSPYPKTYHPYYEQLLRQRLSALLTTGESPLLALIDKEKTMQFLNQEGDYGKPWYGQLMAGPQMIAYLLQIHYWLSEYKIDLHL